MAVHNWQELEEAARQGFGDGLLCAATLICLERTNRPETIEAVNNVGGGKIVRLMRDALLFRMHMVAARAFALSRHPDDIHLRPAVDFVERNCLSDEKLDGLKKARLLKAVTGFRSLDSSDLHRKIERMRHKEMAHVARFGGTLERPIIKDLMLFTRETCNIWEALAHGAGVAYATIDSQVEAYELSADWFWHRFETGQAHPH